MRTRGGEELEIHSLERFLFLSKTDLSLSLLLSFHQFCTSHFFHPPNLFLKPSPPLPFVLVLFAFSVSQELNKPLWRQNQIVDPPWLGYRLS